MKLLPGDCSVEIRLLEEGDRSSLPPSFSNVLDPSLAPLNPYPEPAKVITKEVYEFAQESHLPEPFVGYLVTQVLKFYDLLIDMFTICIFILNQLILPTISRTKDVQRVIYAVRLNYCLMIRMLMPQV